MVPRDLPPNTSASQLTSYAMCPRLFWCRYIGGVEPEFKSLNLILGSAVHNAIGAFFQERLDGREPTAELIERTLRADLCAETSAPNIRWKSTTPEELEAEGLRLVRAYLAEHSSRSIVAVEQPFSVPLADPEAGEVLGRPLRGYFDLVHQGRIIEIKTSAKSWSEWDLIRHLQIGAYAFASHVLHGGHARVEVHVIVKLKKEPRVETFIVQRRAVDLGWWLRAAAEIETAIDARIFPPSPGPLCRECEFQRTCEQMKPETTQAARPVRRLPIHPSAPETSLSL